MCHLFYAVAKRGLEMIWSQTIHVFSQEDAGDIQMKNVEVVKMVNAIEYNLSIAHEPVIRDRKNKFTQVSRGYPPTPDSLSAAQG